MTIVPTVAFLEAIDSGSIHRHNEFAHVHHQLREQIFLEFKADFDRKTKENDRKTNWKKWTSRMKFQSKVSRIKEKPSGSFNGTLEEDRGD
ncbi:hypothetical protein B9Z55_022896 [Caenorhabditis nigoni]|uniref:Uncharacterized protein n=1 Tax=Caenorhabditis nigoni TaxID=1611254 RepID=A0A2G5SMR8_9PELO|nr:hypothetical protein B9Z55_022896 [Caenorhabditis nigoni]